MLSPSRWSLLYHPGSVHVRLASSNIHASAPRRGRNLTERYRTLENTTQTKAKHISQNAATDFIRVPTSSNPDNIVGFVIPQEPRPPADDECCMSGCAVCVYDLHEEALIAYKDSVTKLRAALSARRIPETDWPAHIRTGTARDTKPMLATAEKSRGVVFDAFEEMERALKEKREKRAAVEAEKRARGDVLAEDGGLDLRGVYESIGWLIFPSR